MIKWLRSLIKERQSVSAPVPEVPEQVPPEAPFEVLTVHGAKALSTLLALRSERTDEVPVAFGDRKSFELALEVMNLHEGSFEEVLRLGTELSVPEWVRQRFEEDPEYYTTDGTDSESPRQVEPLSLAYETLGNRPKKEVYIGLIPVSQPWQVPAYLCPGDWNDCPPPEVHVAFFKHWFEHYGAAVTGMSHDTIEFSVERPPATMNEARLLAREQFAYCADIVHQGLITENNLAKVLLNGTNWYFWWD